MTSITAFKACSATLLMMLVPAPSALAHEGASLPNSLKHGFLHPLLGIDHLAAMVAVGLLSAVSLRGAIWRLPLAFVCALLVGGVAGFNGLELVSVELWIMGSLILMGVVLITTKSVGLRWALVAVSLFGFAHGNAHGLELPAGVSATAFTAGFTAASILCHLAGVSLGILAQRSRFSASMLRVGGAFLVGAGVLLLLNA
jgi:urease accessory protein